MLPAAVGENVVRVGKALRSETVTVRLPGGTAIEVKALLEGGDPLVYAWQSNGPVYFDFHGHDERNESGFYTRYADGESVADSGGIVAAYAGQHGWYWENTATEAIDITLTASGFFDELIRLEL